MTEQERMQQEALAMEALEQISGGQKKITKADVERYWNNTKQFVSDHKGSLGATAIALTALAVEGGGRKFKDVKALANALKGFLPNTSVDTEVHEEENDGEGHEEVLHAEGEESTL